MLSTILWVCFFDDELILGWTSFSASSEPTSIPAQSKESDYTMPEVPDNKPGKFSKWILNYFVLYSEIGPWGCFGKFVE